MCDKFGEVFKDKKMFKNHKILEHKDSETEDGDYIKFTMSHTVPENNNLDLESCSCPLQNQFRI